MKKTIILVVLMAVSFTLSAQRKQTLRSSFAEKDDYVEYRKNEISFQYGAPSIMEVSAILSDRPVYNNGKSFSIGNPVFTGTFGLNYNYYYRRNITFGAYLGFGGMVLDYIGENGKKVMSGSVLSFTPLLSAHWIFYKEGIYELSSAVYAGASMSSENIDEYDSSAYHGFEPEMGSFKVNFAYHLTVLKARFGGNVGGFVELGFGYRGIFNAGFSVKI